MMRKSNDEINMMKSMMLFSLLRDIMGYQSKFVASPTLGLTFFVEL